MNPIGLIIVALGAFVVAGGIRDWPWFWKSSRARFVVTVLGRRGARIFYVTVGLFIAVLGVLACFSPP